MIGAPHAAIEPTVYVDGGARFKAATSPRVPLITLGDGDSGGPMDEMLPAEKDYSDLAFVLRELPRHIDHVLLKGFLGGRRDHELANLGEVHQFLRRRTQGRAEFDNVIHAFIGNFELDINGVFSVLALETVSVTIQGACKYRLDGTSALEAASSHGVSNEGFGLVMFSSSKPCFIFLNEVV